VISYFLRYFSSTSIEQISGFRRTFHQFRSGWLCYFCYSRAGRARSVPEQIQQQIGSVPGLGIALFADFMRVFVVLDCLDMVGRGHRFDPCRLVPPRTPMREMSSSFLPNQVDEPTSQMACPRSGDSPNSIVPAQQRAATTQTPRRPIGAGGGRGARRSGSVSVATHTLSLRGKSSAN
jgi:hypothetical protein